MKLDCPDGTYSHWPYRAFSATCRQRRLPRRGVAVDRVGDGGSDQSNAGRADAPGKFRSETVFPDTCDRSFPPRFSRPAAGADAKTVMAGRTILDGIGVVREVERESVALLRMDAVRALYRLDAGRCFVNVRGVLERLVVAGPVAPLTDPNVWT